jgi:hypothetical protein
MGWRVRASAGSMFCIWLLLNRAVRRHGLATTSPRWQSGLQQFMITATQQYLRIAEGHESEADRLGIGNT